MKPKFIILAGPNGAGKSINGHLKVPAGIPIFNGDLVFAELVKQYPHIEPDRLSGGVAVALEKARDKALDEKASFAFETNFSNDLAIDLTTLFKEAGYETIMFYFGLQDIESSAVRVDARVKLGGHQVPLAVIRYNMAEGIKKVNKNLSLFDKIYFIDSQSQKDAQIFAWFTKEPPNCIELDHNNQWFNDHFKTSFQQLSLDIKAGRKPGEAGNSRRKI